MSTAQLALNKRIVGMTPSAPLAINERSRMLAAQGKTIYKLGFGQLPFPVLERIRQALADNAFQKDYLPVKGLMALREAVALFSARRIGLTSQATDFGFAPDHLAAHLSYVAFDGVAALEKIDQLGSASFIQSVGCSPVRRH